MDTPISAAHLTALEDFRNARRAAMIATILAGIRGRENRLLAFEEVRRLLRLDSTSNKKYLTEIPLEAIIGSVNRYQDFTREFLPKKDNTSERWARISQALLLNESLPPIEVFKVGDVYFVNDGNHRVSVARQVGNKMIQAYVTEIKSRVPIQSDAHIEDLIIKAELADFLDQTRLDILRSGADFTASAPEAYEKLSEHIAIHHYYLNINQKRAVPDEEAIIHWYDHHFLPTTSLIQESGLPREFPNKTLVDLYVWLLEHKIALENWLGKEVDLGEVAQDFIVQHGSSFDSITARLKDAVLPDGLERPVPARTTHPTGIHNRREVGRLFSDILVPVDGKGERWPALEQAVIIAQKEKARLYGLHVTSEPDHPKHNELINRFAAFCQVHDVNGELRVVEGETPRVITQQAAWQDLITINLAFRPGASPLSRLTHGFRIIMQRSPRPVLVVPQSTTEVHHAMLAYDGTSGAREALYVAVYIAARWGTRLTILSVDKPSHKASKSPAKEAGSYARNHGIKAQIITSDMPVSQGILQIARQEQVDLIMMGGFSSPPLRGILLDTVADQLLRESQIPLLLCR